MTPKLRWSQVIRSLSNGIGRTRLLPLKRYAPADSIQLKMESDNPHGSSKDRTGLYLVMGLLEAVPKPPLPTIVESTSGNLGIAISVYARALGTRALCLVDPTVPASKLSALRSAGAELEIVEKGDSPDYRFARIARAADLDRTPGYAWTRQYENPFGMRAHEETTGPEIWEQTRGEVEVLVCSVGSGGTVCGVGRFLKRIMPSIIVVAVEPDGSTIFGGNEHPYQTAGAGFRGAPQLIQVYGSVIDFYCKVSDYCSMYHCRSLLSTEGLRVGITTGAALGAALAAASRFPGKRVVAISPDNGDAYRKLIDYPDTNSQYNPPAPPTLLPYATQCTQSD